jgi:type I restriction enzyme M protein
MKKKENYFTTNELAKALGISRVAVFKKIKSKEIAAIEYGNSYLIDPKSLPENIQKKIRAEKDKAMDRLNGARNGEDLDFKKELWSAADKLRGNIDPGEYKHVVLGLIFLKYISDSFTCRRDALEKMVEDKNSDMYAPNAEARKHIINDKNQYKGKGLFFVPEKARWDYLQNNASKKNLGELIDDAMDKLERENPKQLKGILPKIYARTQLDDYVLSEVITLFSKIKFDHEIEKEKDLLGRIYEYFIEQFAAAEGKRGGEFYTPQPLVRLLVEILEPFEGAKVFDPACGSGGMFVQSGKFLKMHNEDPNKISFYGQESNPTTYKLCNMNLAIRGLSGQIELGSSYHNDKHPDLRADFTLANPPFNADWDSSQLSDKDPRIKYGIAPKTNANFMWIQHFLYHTAPNGMSGFVMANGALAVGGKEGEIRKKIIEADMVDTIIACPPKLFMSVALPVSLWFLSKNKANGRFRKRVGETLFIDARETFEQISRKQVTFNDEHIEKIAGAVRAWRGEKGAGKYEDIAGFCKSVKLEEIKKYGYVLTPGRYVGVPEEEEDGIPFDVKMVKLTGELKEYFEEGDKLQNEILKNLNRINE